MTKYCSIDLPCDAVNIAFKIRNKSVAFWQASSRLHQQFVFKIVSIYGGSRN